MTSYWTRRNYFDPHPKIMKLLHLVQRFRLLKDMQTPLMSLKVVSAPVQVEYQRLMLSCLTFNIRKKSKWMIIQNLKTTQMRRILTTTWRPPANLSKRNPLSKNPLRKSYRLKRTRWSRTCYQGWLLMPCQASVTVSELSIMVVQLMIPVAF